MQNYSETNEIEARQKTDRELLIEILRDQDEASEALRRVETLKGTLINANRTADKVLAACLRIQWRWRNEEVV